MIAEWKKDETPKQQTAAEPGSVSAAAQNILEKRFEAYWQAEQVVGDVYNKTTQKVSETYDYSWESLDHSLFSRYFWRNNPTIMPNTEEGKVKWILLCRGPDTPMEPGKVCQDIGLTAS